MTGFHLPEPEEREIHSLSPEARRREAKSLGGKLAHHVGPGTRAWEVAKRTIVGTYNDGFIHAGNLAYLSMLAIFPFFILAGAIFTAFGEEADQTATINAVLLTLPPMVREVIGPVARNVIEARSGWLLWAGAGVGLWTVGSLIETIRDILRRAYGTQATRAFWIYRLLSTGIIFAAVVLLLLAFFAQVMIGTAQEVMLAYFPSLEGAISQLRLSRFITAAALFGSIYVLFYTLTPRRYRARRYPKWPGALATTLWWAAVTLALPPVLRQFFTYDLTYGSLAGIMVALFFFWLVGLGMVIGAELNAALAESPEEAAEAERSEEVEDVAQ